MANLNFATMVHATVMVSLYDFLTGVLSALVIYFVVKYACKKRSQKQTSH